MGQRTVTFDDLDGVSEASDTIVFSVNGEHYTIDLSEEHAKEFLAFIDPYVQAAQPYDAPKSVSKPSMSKEERQSIVEWAATQGITIAPRGRIAADLVKRFKDAQEAAGHATVEQIEQAMKAGEQLTEKNEPETPAAVAEPTSSHPSRRGRRS